jgi:polysaccharide export outer membrane protein
LRVLVNLFGTLALAGCASRESPIPLNSYQTVTATEPVMSATVPLDYRINPLDQLRIDVFGEPNLSLTDLPVGPNGKIVLPMVGEIEAEGRTPTELSRDIAAALNRYLRNPQVAVNVTQFTSQKVTVTGAVRTAGVFPSMSQMTLMDAVALGQGLSDYSKRGEILVFRRQGGRRYVARFDLNMIETGTAADPTILPGDVVVVGYSNSRRLFADSLAVLPAAVGIFIALIK